MFLNTVQEIGFAVLRYLRYDWWILAIGISVAVSTKVYLGEKLGAWMQRKSKYSILGSIGFGAFTPLCACGAMAVILSMFVTAMPWGAVMAFLVASPLTSPTQFVLQSGFLGVRLAVAGVVSAISMGIVAGFLSSYLEKKTDFFKGQYRMKIPSCGPKCSPEPAKSSCCVSAPKVSCCDTIAQEIAATCCSKPSLWQRLKLDEVLKQTWELGVKRVLFLFIIFIALGRLVEMFVPSEIILGLFSPDKFYSVPLAALIGLPLYVSGAAGLPLLESFLAAGASEGAILAFLIAGQGSSIGVIIGISTFLKKKAIGFYVTMILLGSMVSGLIYQALERIL